MLPVTAAVAGLGTGTVKTTADFDSSMSQVQATMGITADSMSKVDGQSVNTMDTLRTLAKQMEKKQPFLQVSVHRHLITLLWQVMIHSRCVIRFQRY